MKTTSIAALWLALLAGCAPDAMDNLKATGFNGFIDRVSVDCAPLVVGSQVVTANYTAPDYALDLYDQWFDATSRLYYLRITPQAYLSEINNFFGDARTQASASCLVSKLPPAEQRSRAPSGRW